MNRVLLMMCLCCVASLSEGASSMSVSVLEKSRGMAKYTCSECSVICLQDAEMRHPVSLFSSIGEKSGEALEKAMADTGYASSLNVFVYEKNGEKYLIDAGNDASRGTLKGKLEQNGIAPESIKGIFVTHIHPDHIGGLLWNGKPLFPNALLYISKAEYEGWRKDAKRAALAKYLLPYEKRIRLFEFGKELGCGLYPILKAGHTPGHTVYRFKISDNLYGYFVGDIMHAVELQAPYPDYCARYDSDPSAAVRARKEVFGLEAPMFGAHFPFPGCATVINGVYQVR